MADAGPSGPIHPLNYEPADPRRRRWRLVRRIVLWTLVLAVGVSAFMFRTELWLRTRRAYWLYECMHHVTPPGTVLIETDPARAARLLATDPNYVQDLDAGSTTASYLPTEWRRYADLALKSDYPFVPDVIAFMGERISPAGRRRLVVIPHADVDDLEFEPRYYSWVVEPTSFLGSGTGNWSGLGVCLPVGLPVSRVSLKPGVADPRDLSHFTIDYFGIFDPAIHGTFDIHLNDDDTLSVKAIEAH